MLSLITLKDCKIFRSTFFVTTVNHKTTISHAIQKKRPRNHRQHLQVTKDMQFNLRAWEYIVLTNKWVFDKINHILNMASENNQNASRYYYPPLWNSFYLLFFFGLLVSIFWAISSPQKPICWANAWNMFLGLLFVQYIFNCYFFQELSINENHLTIVYLFRLFKRKKLIYLNEVYKVEANCISAGRYDSKIITFFTTEYKYRTNLKWHKDKSWYDLLHYLHGKSNMEFISYVNGEKVPFP